MSNFRVNKSFASRVRQVSKRIGHADLTAAATSQVLDFDKWYANQGPPAGSRVIGAAIELATPFSGGGAASVTVDIGTVADDDAVIDGANVFAAAVGGQASTLPRGIAPNLATSAPKIRVASDVNVVDLTAGDMTVYLVFSVPDASGPF